MCGDAILFFDENELLSREAAGDLQRHGETYDASANDENVKTGIGHVNAIVTLAKYIPSQFATSMTREGARSRRRCCQDSEHHMMSFYGCHGLGTVIYGCSILGPRRDPSFLYSGVPEKLETQMLRGEQPTIHGDGEQTRDSLTVNAVEGKLVRCKAPKAEA